MAEPRRPEKAAVQRGYDRWAEIFDEEDNPLIGLEEPVVREALGDVAGLEALDLGCGTGRHALWLARSGARVSPGREVRRLAHAPRPRPGRALASRGSGVES